LFATGVAMNLQSDAILRSLRRPTAQTTKTTNAPCPPKPSPNSHYKIPRGGMFEYVSAPHFLGEIIEWTGFAIMNQGSLATISFAAFTAANLIPRALTHHAWYRETFGVSSDKENGRDNDDDNRYPRRRKAIIPFLW
jgi:3-oxo-5-alpha-steroid 4-dehydrogenase 1